VLAQLSCAVKVARPVSRTVFHPVPNVDSVLVRLERTAPPAPADVRALVTAGFAHRRKALPRSLALAGAAGRDAARAALEELGLAPDVRAERLAPDEWVRLAEALR
jgi:16S rRNA (adenine1518-N6/adenine1519-N6)-dimethyltransferase